MTDWPLVPLGEVIRFVGSGATPRGGKNSYQESGIALIRSMNVFDLQFETKNLAFLSEDQAAELNRVTVEPADVLLNITGASVARCCIAPDQVLPARVNQHVLIIRTDPEKCDPYWLSYALASPYYKACLLNLAGGGATREALTKGGMKAFEVALPAIQVQRRVAAVLASIGSLIENNRRRIELLEETARLLYREWFVNFRYPGHEDVPLVDSELGPIPQGWEVRNLFELANVGFGCSFKSEGFAESGVRRVVRIRDVPRNTTSTWTNEAVEDQYLIHDGDTLIGMDGDFHMCIWADGPAYLNQRVARIRTRGEISQLHLHLALEAPIHHFNQIITGTTVAHLGKRHLEEIHLPLPNQRLAVKASESFEAIKELQQLLRQTNTRLREARDLLLPRLVSGDLEVSDLDLDLEAVG